MSETQTPAAVFELPIDMQSISHTITHPITGVATPASITLAGPTHPIRKAAMFSRMRALLNEGAAERINPEEQDDDETAFVASCTLGWSNITVDGVARPFAIGAAEALYADVRFRWLRDQMREVLRQRDLFIGACATV